jgi:hypothetical protein
MMMMRAQDHDVDDGVGKEDDTLRGVEEGTW